MIRLKRAYDPPDEQDGFRVLVERLWPRGITKQKAALDAWLKEAAPSPSLRSWYAHELEKWEEFKRRYIQELQANPEAIHKLEGWIAAHPTITFVYAARDEEHNSALVLRSFLEDPEKGSR
jgi:uncharacterized protein YeaO (DUF488 family)